MPHLSVCPRPGCPVLTTGGPCHEHRLQARADREANRPSRLQRGYGGKWRKRSAAFLRDHPWCELCTARATDVHHRDGKGPLGPNGYATANLQALCHACHARITAKGG